MKPILATVFGLAVVYSSATTLAAAQDHPGKALFVSEKCNTCHAVESEGIEVTRDSTNAPDLSNAGADIPDAAWAKKFVLREEEKDGKKHRRPYRGSDKDLDSIVEWLMTLKKS